jgi:tripartite-type tricarboxylate transporter receptor subunit TctC
VLVDNRPGAGGQIAAMALKSAPANGSVLFVTNDHTISVLPQMLRNPGFAPDHDFTPVAGFASYVSVFALSTDTPPRSFREYLAWLRKGGGKGNVGIPAPASVPEFLVKAVANRTGLDLVAAPYRGAAPMLADLMAGQIPAAVAAVNDVLEAHNAGRLRVVAVAGAARQAALPQVPTFSELGLPGFEDSGYYGIYAPAGTPPATVQRLSDAVRKVLEQPQLRDRMAAMGLTVEYLAPQQMAAREQAYTQALGRLIESGGFKPR